MILLQKPIAINFMASSTNLFRHNYFLWNKCFDDDFIEKIKNLGETLPTMDAGVGGSLSDTVYANEMRNSKLSWMYLDNNSKFVYDNIIEKIDSINYHQYGMNLVGMDALQYTRYPVNGHYMYHNDIIFGDNNLMRKLSIVLSLSHRSEYDGGEFLLLPHGANPVSLKFGKGDLIAFPSYIPHKVEPVVSGHRITLVGWFYGPTFV